MSASKQKGTAFETLMKDYFIQYFPNARRNPLAGNKDVGDIGGMPVPVECKNVKAMSLSTWLNETAKEAENAGAPFGITVHKRKGYGDPAMQYVTMPAFAAVELLLAYEAQN